MSSASKSKSGRRRRAPLVWTPRPVPSGAEDGSLAPSVLALFRTRRVFDNAEPLGSACPVCDRDLHAVRGALLVRLPCCEAELHMDCAYVFFGENKGCPRAECEVRDLATVELPQSARPAMRFADLENALKAVLQMHSAMIESDESTHAVVTWEGMVTEDELSRGNCDIALNVSRHPNQLVYVTMPRRDLLMRTEIFSGEITVKVLLRPSQPDRQLDSLVPPCECADSQGCLRLRNKAVHTITVDNFQFTLLTREETVALHYSGQEALEPRCVYS